MTKDNKGKMNITTISPDDNISVTALLDNKKVDLDVDYASISEDEMNQLIRKYGKLILPIELITTEFDGDNITVNFDSQNCLLKFIVVNQAGVFKWDHIKVKKHTFPSGKAVHVVISLVPEGVKYNRRRGVRVSIDTRMEIEQNDVKYMVLVRDISYCGFSFINLTPGDFNPAQPFLLHLIERDGDRSFTVGKFVGKVLRTQEMDNLPTVYGCILSEKHAMQLQKYVAMKQMEFISGKKQYSEIQKTSNSQDWRALMAEALAEEDDELE